MSKVVTTTVLPDVAGGSVTLGGTGDSVVVTGNDLRANALQDAGGNAVFTSNGSGVLSGMNSGFGGALNLLSTQTASNTANVSFSSSLITSTYDVYVFKFIDINPATDDTRLKVNFSADGGSNWMTKTSTYFRAIHDVNNTNAQLGYDAGDDLAQSTASQSLCHGIGSATNECGVGELHLFAATSTTYVKHWYSTMQVYYPASGGFSIECFTSGYCNTTSAINYIKFEAGSGNFDGTIKMYGISKS